MSFELILGALLSGVTDALIAKSIEIAPQKGQQIARTVGLIQAQPPDSLHRAVAAAIAGAQATIVDRYGAGDDALATDVILLFEEHATFGEQVAQRLIFQGIPDFDRLRDAYLGQTAGATSARWEALEAPLSDFFTEIEARLLFDRELGPVFAGVRQCVMLARIDAREEAVLAALDTLTQYQAHTAQNSTSMASDLSELVRESGRQTVHLGEVVSLLKSLAAAQTAGTAPASQQSSWRPALSKNEKVYLRRLQEECNRLPLANDKRAAGDGAPRRAELANVYIDLLTTTRPNFDVMCMRLGIPPQERTPELMVHWADFVHDANNALLAETLLTDAPEALQKRRQPLRTNDKKSTPPHNLFAKRITDDATKTRVLARLTAVEALHQHPRLVLLGDPGSGKSTFVNHLAYTLAGAWLDDGGTWREGLAIPAGAPYFPLRVVLRRWSATLTAESTPGAGLVYAALAALVKHDGRLDDWLEDPATLICFDGLDEAPPAGGDGGFDRRRIIVDSVQDFCVAHPRCRVLVTSRIKPYQQGGYQLPEWPAFELATLDQPRIDRFIALWYRELARIQAPCVGGPDAARARLEQALGRRPVLRKMAETPLLLTMLARVNARRGLPESRAELYHECVEQLLWEWEKSKEDDAHGGIVALADLLAADGANLQRADVERVLWELAYAAQLQSGSQAALIAERELEDRLARLHPQRNKGKAWAGRVVELMSERGGLLDNDGVGHFSFPHASFQEYLAARWLLELPSRLDEVARLAAIDTWREVILLACGYLTWTGRHAETQAIVAELTAKVALPQDYLRLVVGGQAWREFGPQRATGNLGAELKEKAPALLTGAMQDDRLTPAQRLAAGLLAADLGALPPDPDALIRIPGTNFHIGKYPVTNHQYRQFVAAGGYAPEHEDRWWSEDGRRNKQAYRYSQPSYWNDDRFDHPSRPVVGVSWYEAEAYCAWLTAHWRKKGTIQASEVVRLPSVAEWELAARDGGVAPANAEDDYPWQGPFDPSRANTEESALGQTTPVHMYSTGATPSGIMDLAGNVWEWTIDGEKNKDGNRRFVLKGGSWHFDAERALASSAFGFSAWSYWGSSFGIRVVVVPISPG